jgi:hypothetical protein
VSPGPLAVRFGAMPSLSLQAGTRTTARVELENAGSLAWDHRVSISSHWLDDRGNPIVWDGPRAPLPPLAPDEHGCVDVPLRVPIPPGRYRLAFDLVAELRAWTSELGSPMLEEDVEVLPREGEPNAELPAWVEPTQDWDRRVRAAHADGFGVVAGAIRWDGGLLHHRPRALAPYEPGGGRNPAFAAPLVCPSVLPGIELERLEDVAGLPAYAAPQDEPWIYDGRAVLRVRPR